MDDIISYFVNEKGTTVVIANLLSKTLNKYADIKTEFCYWVDNKSYDCENPIEICGYTAKKIHEIAPHLDGAGVYNFLVTLRENPEKAQEHIDKGFPTK